MGRPQWPAIAMLEEFGTTSDIHLKSSIRRCRAVSLLGTSWNTQTIGTFFPDNIGPRIAMDESSLSNGELYTFVNQIVGCMYQKSIPGGCCGNGNRKMWLECWGCINEEKRFAVEEVTLDLSDSMRKDRSFGISKARRVIDRFHSFRFATCSTRSFMY